jgi:hypothetical protein
MQEQQQPAYDDNEIQESEQQLLFQQPHQTKRPLTLYDISRSWAERLGANKAPQQQLPFPLSSTWIRWYSEIKNPSTCIVGEAYFYSKSYLKTCKECTKLSVKFMNSFLIHSQSRLDKNKKDFVNHWNEKHLKK